MALNSLDGRFIQVNRALCEMLGYSEEELLATTFKDITRPDDDEISTDHVQQALENELGSYQIEKRYLHADGHPMWVSLNVSLVRDPDENPLYLDAQMQDITERKRAEELLSRLAAFVEFSEDAIISKTLDGTITSWNADAERLYGYTADEIIGYPISVLIPPDYPNDVSGILEKIRRGESVDFYETVRMTKSGNRVHIP